MQSTMEAKKTVKQYLKCDFTNLEIAEKARELATANRRRESIEQQKKEIDSDLKSKIEAENTVIKRASEAITTGFEYRDVECTVLLDHPIVGQKTYIRMDTGEECKVEPMTDADKQMSLEMIFERSRMIEGGPAIDVDSERL